MQRLFLSLMPVGLAVLLAACSSSGSSYALIGVPAQNSYTESANFLISGNQCNYYTYRGDGTNPPEVGIGCTLLKDKKNALGAPHSFIEIGFTTPKGQQILSLRQFGNNTLIASSVPDIGMYTPSNWTISAPASDMILNSTVAANIYSGLAVHISGVRCSLTITAVANNTPVSMPCGLTYWSASSISIAIPGALISTAYAQSSWTLNFIQDAQKSGAWNLARPPNGFPTTYAQAATSGS
ncbi:MAG: hypothetical protein WCC11_06265 [Gammaproteobacteria bacterium]